MGAFPSDSGGRSGMPDAIFPESITRVAIEHRCSIYVSKWQPRSLFKKIKNPARVIKREFLRDVV